MRILTTIAIAGLIASGMTGCSSKSDNQDDKVPAEAKQAAQVETEDDGQEAVAAVGMSELLGALTAGNNFGVGSTGKTQNKVLASLPSFKSVSSEDPQENEGEQDCTYGGTRTYESSSTPSFSGHYIYTYTYNNCVEAYLPCGLNAVLPDPYDLHPRSDTQERYTVNGVYVDEMDNSNGPEVYTQEAQSLTVNVEDNTTKEKIYDASADGIVSNSTRYFDVRPSGADFTERVYTANIEQSLKVYGDQGEVTDEQTSSAVNVELNATSSENSRTFVANGYMGVTTDGVLSYLIFENYVSTWSWSAAIPLDGSSSFTADITINGKVGASCLGGQVNVTTTETIVLDTNVEDNCEAPGEETLQEIPGYQLSTTIPKAGEVEISGDGEAVVSFDYNDTTHIASATITIDDEPTTYTCAEDMIGNSGCGDILNPRH